MNKDFERCCSFLADMIIKYADNMLQDVYIYQETSFMASGVSFILHCIMEKVLVEQQLE